VSNPIAARPCSCRAEAITLDVRTTLLHGHETAEVERDAPPVELDSPIDV
jgi:hypothetical protein